VNGCQTATTIALAQKEGKLAADVRILTRIYETEEPALVNKIVLTTNNQNQISSRDLRANDPAQVDMEAAFEIFGYKYERKPRQFDVAAADLSKLFTNEYVAQAYLAVVLKAPSDARTRKYKVWGELHSKIFSGGAVEPYIIAAVIASRASDWLRNSANTTAANETARLLAKRGSFHVARIATYLWRGTDDWKAGAVLKDQVSKLDDVESLKAHFAPALSMLAEVIANSPEHAEDVDKALKSSVLDKDIDKHLHKP
jgi:hypothetical protein